MRREAKSCVVTALVLSALTATAQKRQATKAPVKIAAASPVDSHYGFRGFKLGTSISLHPELVNISTDSLAPRQIYKLENENLKVGQANLQSITYVYYKHQLLSVLIVVTGGIDRGSPS